MCWSDTCNSQSHHREVDKSIGVQWKILTHKEQTLFKMIREDHCKPALSVIDRTGTVYEVWDGWTATNNELVTLSIVLVGLWGSPHWLQSIVNYSLNGHRGGEIWLSSQRSQPIATTYAIYWSTLGLATNRIQNLHILVVHCDRYCLIMGRYRSRTPATSNDQHTSAPRGHHSSLRWE